ncbi:rhodanese-like domain-containing protein [Bacillus suaedae]|uniref:rhodanese-like domain-containing protein n=1 Tax=Halalkalibacter suaedae TaxID=2822140 RepID=UPI0032119670
MNDLTFEQDGIKQVEVDELKALLEKKSDIVFIDVRELDEYDQGHIPGIPLIPMNTIPQFANEMDKEQTYLFICRSGGRSQNVSLYMKEQGFQHVMNYSGGMLAWTGDVQTGPEWIVKDSKELKQK